MAEMLVRALALSRFFGTGEGAVGALREATFEIGEAPQPDK